MKTMKAAVFEGNGILQYKDELSCIDNIFQYAGEQHNLFE